MKRKSPDSNIYKQITSIIEDKESIFPKFKNATFLVGKGTFSKVYKYEASEEKMICVKIIDSISKEDFTREARISKSMSEYKIGPCVYATKWVEETGYIFMDYLPISYRKLQNKDTILRVIDLVRKISNAGICSLDIKPSCIRKSDKGDIHLIDYSCDWVVHFPKTCTCIDHVVWPSLCSCHVSSRKKLSFSVMILLLFLTSANREMSIYAGELWRTFRKTRNPIMKLIDKAFQHDPDVSEISMHYLYSSDMDESKYKRLRDDRVFIKKFWNNFKSFLHLSSPPSIEKIKN